MIGKSGNTRHDAATLPTRRRAKAALTIDDDNQLSSQS
jgi:hypothetical protein